MINGNLGSVSLVLRYGNLLVENCKYSPPLSCLPPLVRVTPSEFLVKLYTSRK